MSAQDRAARLSKAVELFRQMMRPPGRLFSDDEEITKDRVAEYMAPRAAEFARLIESAEELDEVQSLYFELIGSFRDLEDEQFVKMAYLVTHSPGMPVPEAIAHLTPSQRAEYEALTAADLRLPSDGEA